MCLHFNILGLGGKESTVVCCYQEVAKCSQQREMSCVPHPRKIREQDFRSLVFAIAGRGSAGARTVF